MLILHPLFINVSIYDFNYDENDLLIPIQQVQLKSLNTFVAQETSLCIAVNKHDVHTYSHAYKLKIDHVNDQVEYVHNPKIKMGNVVMEFVNIEIESWEPVASFPGSPTLECEQGREAWCFFYFILFFT